MKIGELARRSGVGIDAIRFYERQALLPPPLRMESGYRSYRDDDLARLRFVRRAKALGFSLAEIRDLLALSGRVDGDMGELRAAAVEKLADVDAKMAELERIRAGLAQLIDACPGHGRLAHCPILGALSGEDEA
ncbi:heavy metal-responsive transcriptional regulator [Pseudoxanthomonas kalamensis DSM 18571]|uniref:heavy metal-responsive transcriptional regulator n=1 Tax=Pseudoxanthomonas kalamensis TaxID=289483 RepID=UPI0013915683|nr:heavy metal-responsive transcriptional regulator [Pseudoxanthomonas kalamensis]KAF1712405.1 heavy metal-responsive transcriptional regulator [Pseudoxanthomonas kalamensis DSM 18571]